MPSYHGLTAAEVETRRAAGQTNQPPRSQTKTTGEIVRDNICTYFNLVFLVLAVMLALVRSWLNMGFLGIVFWNTLIGIVQQLRAKLGDRACLRAVHYWYENGLVDKRWAALNAGDIDQFLVLTRESGASSAMYLQNVVAKLGAEQPSMYALALAEHVLDGRGAVRIHGGGFGGTIQAFVPLDLVDTFITKMNSWLGEGSARHYAISDKGAYAAWL